MPENEIKNIIEAALFAYGKPLTLDALFLLFQEEEAVTKDILRDAIAGIEQDCQVRGVELKKVASGYRFQAKQDYAKWLQPLWEEKPPRYSRALLETIVLIAYKQPITRGEIEDVRGVSVSSHIVKTLQERDWIRVVGHRDVPGKPALFATTKGFLDYFNLSSLDQLPSLAQIRDLDKINEELEFPDGMPAQLENTETYEDDQSEENVISANHSVEDEQESSESESTQSEIDSSDEVIDENTLSVENYLTDVSTLSTEEFNTDDGSGQLNETVMLDDSADIDISTEFTGSEIDSPDELIEEKTLRVKDYLTDVSTLTTEEFNSEDGIGQLNETVILDDSADIEISAEHDDESTLAADLLEAPIQYDDAVPADPVELTVIEEQFEQAVTDEFEGSSLLRDGSNSDQHRQVMHAEEITDTENKSTNDDLDRASNDTIDEQHREKSGATEPANSVD